MKKAWYNCFEN